MQERAKAADYVTEIMRRPAPSHAHEDLLRVTAVLVLAVAVGVAAYFLLVLRGTSTSPPATTGQGAIAVSQQGLQTLASLGRPIYWAGAKPGDTYELTQSPSDGRVYVRYLPAGVKVGAAGIYLTIATYPFVNAYAVTKTVARQPGSVTVPVRNGGVAFYKADLPTNIYLAYPGSQYQVEVFDPSASAARSLVTSGGVSKVVAKNETASVPKTAAVAASPADLRKLSTRLGRPIYWAGEESGSTYELTQTPDGRIYVRYLPAGVAVGSDTPYLTVATYPVANAYKTTKKAAAQPGAVTIPVAGGVAFYNTSLPTSVYVAFPGVNEQIEVFDPSAALVQKTVATQKIHAISPG